MKAIRIHQNGGTEVLRVDDIAEPVPTVSQVKIAIQASALNHMDLWVREGIPGMGALPLTLGCDGAGVVVELGDEVKHLKINDRVLIYPVMNFLRAESYEEENANLSKNLQLLGEHMNGTHCEYICVPATHVVKIPDHLDFVSASSFPLTFITAWHMLVRKGRIRKGQDVLIVAASSGVGVAAVQIAKHFGARVIATSSGEERLQKLRHLGADAVVDHYQESVSKRVKELTQGKGVELVFEHVGESLWQECLKSMAWGGRLVTCGATSGPNIKMDMRHIFIKQQEILGSTMGSIDELLEICERMRTGALKPIVDRVFDFQDVAWAHEYLAKQKPFGKVVLKWK